MADLLTSYAFELVELGVVDELPDGPPMFGQLAGSPPPWPGPRCGPGAGVVVPVEPDSAGAGVVVVVD